MQNFKILFYYFFLGYNLIVEYEGGFSADPN